MAQSSCGQLYTFISTEQAWSTRGSKTFRQAENKRKQRLPHSGSAPAGLSWRREWCTNTPTSTCRPFADHRTHSACIPASSLRGVQGSRHRGNSGLLISHEKVAERQSRPRPPMVRGLGCWDKNLGPQILWQTVPLTPATRTALRTVVPRLISPSPVLQRDLRDLG